MDILGSICIDRVIRGVMKSSSTSAVLWSVNQITDPSISATAENTEIVDALGTPVAVLDRAKKCELSATNALFDFGLLAAQMGAERKLSTSTVTFVAPCFDEVTVPSSGASVTLAHTPLDVGGVAGTGLPFIYKLNGDGTLATRYAYNATPGADSFSYTGTTLTYPTGLTAGDRIFAPYEYTADNTDEAMQIVNSAENFPTAGSFTMEVLFRDICDPATKIHGYVIFPKSKLDANFDVNFTPDGKHAFKLLAQQDYCDTEKTLCKIVVPEYTA